MDHFSDAQPILVLVNEVYNNLHGNCSTAVSQVRRINYLISPHSS